MKLANTGQTPRPGYQAAPNQTAVAAAPAAATTPRAAELNLNLSGGAGALEGHARGGNGIFGEPKVISIA